MLGQGLNGGEWERWAESDKSYIIRQEGVGGAPQKFEVRPLDLRKDRFFCHVSDQTQAGRDAEAAVPVAGSCA